MSTATKAFDIVEIFFRSDKAQTNLPLETYNSSPVLHFLLNTVSDRLSLEEFMTVWKHIMPFRWVIYATEPTPSVLQQLSVIREKLDNFRNREMHIANAMAQEHHNTLCLQHQHQQQMPAQQDPAASNPKLAEFLQALMRERSANEMSQHLENTWRAPLLPPTTQFGVKKDPGDLQTSQIASLVDATGYSMGSHGGAIGGMPPGVGPQPPGLLPPPACPTDLDSTLYSQVSTALQQQQQQQQGAPMADLAYPPVFWG